MQRVIIFISQVLQIEKYQFRPHICWICLRNDKLSLQCNEIKLLFIFMFLMLIFKETIG